MGTVTTCGAPYMCPVSSTNAAPPSTGRGGHGDERPVGDAAAGPAGLAGGGGPRADPAGGGFPGLGLRWPLNRRRRRRRGPAGRLQKKKAGKTGQRRTGPLAFQGWGTAPPPSRVGKAAPDSRLGNPGVVGVPAAVGPAPRLTGGRGALYLPVPAAAGTGVLCGRPWPRPGPGLLRRARRDRDRRGTRIPDPAAGRPRTPGHQPRAGRT